MVRLKAKRFIVKEDKKEFIYSLIPKITSNYTTENRIKLRVIEDIPMSAQRWLKWFDFDTFNECFIEFKK